MRLLIVGFGPFPRVPRNPSGVLARRLAELTRLRRALGAAPRCLVMRTAYDAIPAQLEPALAERPDAILMIGVAARAKRVRVEHRACNRASRLFPDASGNASQTLTLERDGPRERRSRAAAMALVTLRRLGLDACPSRDAGRYLCNASYFRALADERPTLFLHIPMPRRCVRRGGRRRRQIDVWTNAFAAIALGLVASAQSRRRLS